MRNPSVGVEDVNRCGGRGENLETDPYQKAASRVCELSRVVEKRIPEQLAALLLSRPRGPYFAQLLAYL